MSVKGLSKDFKFYLILDFMRKIYYVIDKYILVFKMKSVLIVNVIFGRLKMKERLLILKIICGVCGMVMKRELLKKDMCCWVFNFLGMLRKGFFVFNVVCIFDRCLKNGVLLLFGSVIVFIKSFVFLLVVVDKCCFLMIFFILEFFIKFFIMFLYKFCKVFII